MNKRLLGVVVFALITSAVASFILFRLISSRLVANAKPATAQIVLAARDLNVGELLRDLDLRTADWTGDLPKGAFTRKEDVVGRGVVSNLYMGEPVLDTRIAAKGAGAGLAATIRPGMRAVAVRVNDVVGVGGFVTPGMRVDILVAGTPPGQAGSSQGTLSKTVLQNIEVLSAGQKIEKDAEGKPEAVAVVNLLVTPEQAETLSLASNETRIQLVLRNPLDTETTKTPGTAVANLFSGGTGLPSSKPVAAPVRRAVVKPVISAPPPAPEPQKVIIPITVEVIHGAKRVQAQFKEEEKSESEAKN